MRVMKDSNISYIGEIPRGWKIGKYKFFAKSRMGETILKSDTDEYGVPIYSATSDDSIFGYLKNPKLKLKKGDIVIPARGTIGKATYVNYELATCTQTTICSYDIKINNKYLYYVILALNKEWFHSEKTSVPLITVEQLNNVYIPIPKKEEQDKIVNFLDEEIKKIDQVIEKTKETIDDYKKYKQAIITKFVTKGLAESAKMRDSGIDWIGKIPKNWKVEKIRYLGNLQNGISAGADKFGEGYPFANYGDIYNNFELPKKLSGLIKSTDKERENYSIKKNDIFFTRTSETIEEVGLTSVATKDIKNACFSGFIIRFRPKKNNMKAEFYKYYFRSDIHRRYFVKEMNIVTRASLGQDLLKSMPILVPSEKEQLKIAEFLDEKCKKIDTLIKSKIKILEELEEYKKSLIYEYVTGKKEIMISKDTEMAELSLRILEQLPNNYSMCKIKLNKIQSVILKMIKYNREPDYEKYAAGPYSKKMMNDVYDTFEKEKWVKISKDNMRDVYTLDKNYKEGIKRYQEHFKEFDNEITRIIKLFENKDTQESEIIATLFYCWNDFLIDGIQPTDEQIIQQFYDWSKRKKYIKTNRVKKNLVYMRKNNLIPNGFGKKTIQRSNNYGRK